MSAFIYILRCKDASLYTGITTDYKRRFQEHIEASGKAARYTRSHPVLRMAALFAASDMAAAARLEYRLKRLPKEKKEALLQDSAVFADLFPALDASIYQRMPKEAFCLLTAEDYEK